MQTVSEPQGRQSETAKTAATLGAQIRSQIGNHAAVILTISLATGVALGWLIKRR